MIQLPPDINKKFILEKLSQEEILEKYLGVEITFTEAVCSPLRNDSRPTCTFKQYPNGNIVFKDWSGDFIGNCFEVVMRKYGIGFRDACKKIAVDFNLVKGGFVKKKLPKTYNHKLKKDNAKIQVKYRPFTEADRDYWISYGICSDTLARYYVKSVRFAWVGETLRYSFRQKDPCYIYHFGSKVKLYFPLREEYRFLGNYVGLQGYYQLPATGDYLVITKSLKDVMFLHQLGIPAVAPPSESSILTEEQYKELSKRFKQLVCFYDFDRTGLRSVNKMHRLYGIPRVFLTNGRFGSKDYKAKDITDLYKKEKDERKIKELCQVVKTFLSSKTEKEDL